MNAQAQPPQPAQPSPAQAAAARPTKLTGRAALLAVVYCLATPADRMPFFRKPVSSTASTAAASPRSRVT
jgi:hypothetical protein